MDKEKEELKTIRNYLKLELEKINNILAGDCFKCYANFIKYADTLELTYLERFKEKFSTLSFEDQINTLGMLKEYYKNKKEKQMIKKKGND